MGTLLRRGGMALAAAAGLLGASCASPAPAAVALGSPPGFPPSGALTMAGEAGQVLVGLSLEPGEPGANTVIVLLVPVLGTGATSLDATISDGGAARRLEGCGGGCRHATLSLHGGEALDVDVQGTIGGRASFTVPRLPAPSGEGLLVQADSRMHGLHAYADHNTLFGGIGPTIVTDIVAEAPDRGELSVEGNQTIWIGTTQWARTGPDQPWAATTGMQAARYPYFVWDPFAPLVDARVVGTQVVGGTPTTEVSFFGTDPGIPIWFEVWVTSSGLILKSSMLAQGHFMHDSYSDFDQPLSISAPAG